MDTANQTNVSDTAGRAGSQAEPHRAGSSQAEHREGAGSRAEPRRESAGSQAEPRPAVSDSLAHDRHDEGAERRQELDRKQPLDASGNIAERVRATTFTADAKGAAAAEADAKGAADADAEAPGRAARAGVDGEKTPILAALARLRTKQSERARRGPAPRLRPVPNVVGANLRLGAVSSCGGKDTREAKAPRPEERGAGRSSSEVLRGCGGVRACVRTHIIDIQE